ncbi:peptidylprolyl isomerase [Epibacterium ulvae]|uniref:peptidylprolyl isomerase n=1 Tax=Epibacterium ulvae TaxID=1156985 RepID=UPI002490A751|nr:peptidylprolyl isomerase [Epibacterium ulvae]
MKQLSKTFVWILMGMLIVGLMGFGAVSFTGSASSVARVGDENVTVQDFARELQQEQRALQAQTGQTLPISQMAALGLDRNVLAQLISVAAIDNETRALGVSTGDENLQREILEIPAFQGIDGQFDRETYAFSLQNAGLNEREFEANIRKGTARTLLQGAIMGGVQMPEILGDTLTAYIGARRSFSYVALTDADLALESEAPDEATLRAFYDENIDAFTLPETKVITYVQLTPEALVGEVDVDETALRDLFEQRADFYQQPERRLVERLVFANQDAAETAKAQLDLGGTSFETLVIDRGLTLQDVDLGDLTKEALGEAGDPLFAAEIGAVVGPFSTDLGPALYRVNGTLAARTTVFEDVRDELQNELAIGRARRVIEQRGEEIEDLLAGGATLEELAQDEGMSLAQIDWHAEFDGEIAAYAGFRAKAAAVQAEDFPSVDFLEDGSLYALRLDEVLAPRPEPFADAQAAVETAWLENQREQALRAQADDLLKTVQEQGDFPEAANVLVETGLTRTAYIDTTPADMLNRIFELELGELAVVQGDDSTVVVRLDEILEPADSAELTLMANAIDEQLNQSLAQALFRAFVEDAQVRARPQIDQHAVNAVLANFH